MRNPVLDKHLQSMEEVAFFRGSTAVEKKGEIILAAGYGQANSRTKNNPDTVFQIGSITKQFTAAVVLELGIDLHAPINDFLPPVREWEGIAVEHLLAHTSGIPNYTDWPDYMRSARKLTVDKILTRVRKQDCHFRPGSEFEYCNTGYILLGIIIEVVTGKKYGEVLEEKILKPAKMTSTGVYEEGLPPHARAATGYALDRRGEKLEEDHSENFAAALSDGGIYSTVLDMLKWSHVLDGADDILSKKTLQLMTTPGKEGFGLGIEVGDLFGKKALYHAGKVAGFNADFCKVPEEKLTIVTLGNNLDYYASHVTGVVSRWYFQGDDAVSFAIPIPEDFDFSPGKYRSRLDRGALIEIYQNRVGQLFIDDGRPSPLFLLSDERLFSPLYGVEYEQKRDGSVVVYDAFNNEIDTLY